LAGIGARISQMLGKFNEYAAYLVRFVDVDIAAFNTQ